MAMRTGFIQGLDYGEGASVTATAGKVNGGSWENDTALDWLFSLSGKADAQFGMVGATGSATFAPTSATLMALALRASVTAPTLTDLTFEGGDTSSKFRHVNSKINRLTVEGRIGQPLMSTVEWIARTPSEIDGAVYQTVDSGAILQWYQGVCTLNSATYSMQSFSVTVENNLTPYSSLDTATTDSQRLPEELVIGAERVTGSFELGVPPGTNVSAGLDSGWADAPTATNSASLAFTSATPTTVTIALGGMTLTRWSVPWVADGVYTYAVDFEAVPNTAGSIAIT